MLAAKINDRNKSDLTREINCVREHLRVTCYGGNRLGTKLDTCRVDECESRLALATK